MNLSLALGYSPQPPVSVYGTGCHNLSLETFLGVYFPFNRLHLANSALIPISTPVTHLTITVNVYMVKRS